MKGSSISSCPKHQGHSRCDRLQHWDFHTSRCGTMAAGHLCLRKHGPQEELRVRINGCSYVLVMKKEDRQPGRNEMHLIAFVSSNMVLVMLMLLHNCGPWYFQATSRTKFVELSALEISMISSFTAQKIKFTWTVRSMVKPSCLGFPGGIGCQQMPKSVFYMLHDFADFEGLVHRRKSTAI